MRLLCGRVSPDIVCLEGIRNVRCLPCTASARTVCVNRMIQIVVLVSLLLFTSLQSRPGVSMQ